MQKLDDDFIMFLRWRGFNIVAGLITITLFEPQNFASYRQAELDTGRIGSYMQLEQLPYMSKRFMMERFLGLSKEEIVENEQLWREERDEPDLETTQGQDLRAIGVTPAGLESDIAMGQELGGGQMAPELGAQTGAGPAPATAGAVPGAGTAATPAGGVPGV
jgi:hypothetical protein